MKIEEALCRAFCDGITVSEVPAGLAVSTPFEDTSGERISFYLVKDGKSGLYRIEDDGELVPSLIASGTNILKGSRGRLFQSLLEQGRIEFDTETGELRTPFLQENDVPAAAMRFVALLVRVASLTSTNPEMVSRNFRDDALERIRADLSASFEIREGEEQPLTPSLAEFEPDVYLIAPNKTPVAVFVAVSDQRIYEAILMQMAADHEAKVACSVVSLIDREGSKLTTKRMRQRARNRLAAAPEFYGEEAAAVQRIAQEADRRLLAH
jgi:hypothetical protein